MIQERKPLFHILPTVNLLLPPPPPRIFINSTVGLPLWSFGSLSKGSWASVSSSTAWEKLGYVMWWGVPCFPNCWEQSILHPFILELASIIELLRSPKLKIIPLSLLDSVSRCFVVFFICTNFWASRCILFFVYLRLCAVLFNDIFLTPKIIILIS